MSKNKKNKKKVHVRHIRSRVLIVCEDLKSSRLYLDDFKKDDNYRAHLKTIDIQNVHPPYTDPMNLVNYAKEEMKKAKKEKNDFDEVYVVIDKDQHSNLKTAMDIAEKNNITCILSAISFEVWVLLHFNYTTYLFSSSDEVVKEIKKYIETYSKKESVYSSIIQNTETAIRNAVTLRKYYDDAGTSVSERGAYTNMDLLIKKLIGIERFNLKTT